MNTILIAIPPTADAPTAVAEAITRAHEIGGRLIALIVLDPEVRERMAATLTNIGWVGERVSDGVVDTLAREQRTRAEATLACIVERARAAGVSASALIEDGDPTEVCARVIRELRVSEAVIVAERRSWLARFVSGAAPAPLPNLPGCRVKVIEED